MAFAYCVCSAYDTDLDLYYLQSRYYDPNTGRFINCDTVDYLDPESINGLNLYAYCLNNPIMYCDPTGHAFFSVLLAGIIAGAIVGGTYGGLLAYSTGQNVLAGIGFGMLAGGIMGAGSVVAGEFVIPVVTGGATISGLSAGASVGIGCGIAAISGLIAGMAGDVGLQYANTGTIDWGQALISGAIWAGLNTLTVLSAASTGILVTFGTNLTLNLSWGFLYGTWGLLFDYLRSPFYNQDRP